MSDDGDREVREFKLEGMTLVVLGALLVAALVGSFFFGRWYERRNLPELAQSGAGAVLDPLRNVAEPGETEDAASELTFFDTLAGDGKEAEPRREVTRPKPKPADPVMPKADPKSAERAPSTADEARPAKVEKPAPAKAEAAPSSTVSESGPFFVQVHVGRDRQAVEQVVAKLKRSGFPVRLDSESDGGQRLYKVRVGGYTTRNEATSTMGRLRDAGYADAFIKELG